VDPYGGQCQAGHVVGWAGRESLDITCFRNAYGVDE